MATTRQIKPRLEQLKLLLLGDVEFKRGASALRFPRRKTWALLVYLALEPGPNSRDKLAALLWPDSDQGRTNLRTTVAELKAELSNHLRVWRDSVELDLQGLELDLRIAENAIQAAYTETQLEAALKLFRGDLLEGFDLPDAPEFDDWLLAEREVVRGWRDSLLERLANLQSQAGKFAAALENAHQRLRLEPLNEAAHRQIIEIHLANGNRSAALEAFNTCHELLQRELGLEPDPQTQSLLGRFRASPAVLTAAVLPTLQTRMVGREREWVLMEAAWQAGQAIIVHGAPGAGKSRLMLEFAASRGAYLHCLGRPGDALVSYGTHARTFKQITDTFDPAEIPQWVRRELSRIIPELGETPPPISSQDDKLRFFEAKAEMLRLYFAKGCAVMAFDDVQFVDAASLEAEFYALFKFLPAGPGMPRSIHSYRSDELSPVTKALIQQAVDSGIAALIEVRPLESADIGEILAGLEVSDQLAQPLHRFTGGNPLFLLETVRSLSQEGGLQSLTPEQFENRRRIKGLTRSPKVQAIIERRLSSLSPQARDLSRVAALMGEYFNLELGSKVLEKGLLETSQAAEELEATQVWQGDRFSHDLIFETTLEGIPNSLAPILHKRVMEVLQTVKTPFAVLAHHAYGGGQWKKALFYSIEAAHQTENNPDLLHLEHCLRARQLILEPPKGFDPALDSDSQQRIDLLYLLIDALKVLRREEEINPFASEMLEYARRIGDARLEIRVLLPRYKTARMSRELQEQRLSQALSIAERLGDKNEWVVVQNVWIYHEFSNAKYQAALARAAEVLPVARALHDPNSPDYKVMLDPLYRCLLTVAQAYLWSGHWDEALMAEQEAEIMLRPYPEHPLNMSDRRMWLAALLLNLGRLKESLLLGQEAMETQYKISFNYPETSVSSLWHSLALLDHGDLEVGLETSTQSYNLVNVPKTDPQWRTGVYWNHALALLMLGQAEAALQIAFKAFEINQEQIGRSAWGTMQQDYIASLICTLFALQGDWDKACEYAPLAAQGRFEVDNEAGPHTPRMRRDLETEALLRGGEIELARESVRRLGEFAGHYVRRQIPYLRARAVLETWEGNLEDAIQTLEEARGLMIPIGLPNERWTLEVELAKLYTKTRNVERAEEAQKTALEVVHNLAEKISDPAIKQTFLEFSQNQTQTW